MSWSDFEQRAAAHEARQSAIDKENQRLADEERLKSQQENEQKAREEEKRIMDILGRLDAYRALEAIRDDVWREGRIEPIPFDWNHFTNNHSAGLVLRSDTFPSVTVLGSQRRPYLKLEKETTDLSVYVSGVGDDDKRKVTVVDRFVYDVNRGSSYNVGLDVRLVGLSINSLSGLETVHYAINPSETQATMDSSVPEATDNFAFMLHQRVLDRIHYKSLPADIRQWTNGMAAQFPFRFDQVDAYNLREWSYQVRSTPWLVRLWDQFSIYLEEVTS